MSVDTRKVKGFLCHAKNNKVYFQKRNEDNLKHNLETIGLEYLLIMNSFAITGKVLSIMDSFGIHVDVTCSFIHVL